MKWKERMVRVQAKREMKKLYKKHSKKLEEIKDKIADYMESVKEEQQMHALIILCSETIAGFENKEKQEFILEGTKKTLELLNNSN